MTISLIASSSLSPGLRGALTRWYTEVLAGMFVGTVSRRVRDELWREVAEWVWSVDNSYAALITAAQNERGFHVETAGTAAYQVVDLDGIQTIFRIRKEMPHAEI